MPTAHPAATELAVLADTGRLRPSGLNKSYQRGGPVQAGPGPPCLPAQAATSGPGGQGAGLRLTLVEKVHVTATCLPSALCPFTRGLRPCLHICRRVLLLDRVDERVLPLERQPRHLLHRLRHGCAEQQRLAGARQEACSARRDQRGLGQTRQQGEPAGSTETPHESSAA